MEHGGTSAAAAIVEAPRVGSIIAVAAHPDDIESWYAGTLARAIDGGVTVRLLLVTSGDKGSADPAATPDQVAARREQEAQGAAARLGIAEVAFLRYLDGGVDSPLASRDPLHPQPRAPVSAVSDASGSPDCRSRRLRCRLPPWHAIG